MVELRRSGVSERVREGSLSVEGEKEGWMKGERVDKEEGDGQSQSEGQRESEGQSESEGAVPGPVLPTRFTLYLAWMAIRAAPALKGVQVIGEREREH